MSRAWKRRHGTYFLPSFSRQDYTQNPRNMTIHGGVANTVPVFFDKYWISANGLELARRLSGRILEYLEVRGLDAA